MAVYTVHSGAFLGRKQLPIDEETSREGIEPFGNHVRMGVLVVYVASRLLSGSLIYSGAKNGFAISSDPSTGLRRVIVGPRSTASPSERLVGWGSNDK